MAGLLYLYLSAEQGDGCKPPIQLGRRHIKTCQSAHCGFMLLVTSGHLQCHHCHHHHPKTQWPPVNPMARPGETNAATQGETAQGPMEVNFRRPLKHGIRWCDLRFSKPCRAPKPLCSSLSSPHPYCLRPPGLC